MFVIKTNDFSGLMDVDQAFELFSFYCSAEDAGFVEFHMGG